jgi:hypothetical protein
MNRPSCWDKMTAQEHQQWRELMDEVETVREDLLHLKAIVKALERKLAFAQENLDDERVERDTYAALMNRWRVRFENQKAEFLKFLRERDLQGLFPLWVDVQEEDEEKKVPF